YNPLTRPILILSVTGEDLEPVRFKMLVEKMLRDNLEKVEGVASAAVSGGVNREILVEIDQGRLEANHLAILEVIQSVEEANVSYPAGSIKKGLYEYLIRTLGEFRTVKEIEYAVAGVDTMKDLRREDTSFIEKDDKGPRTTMDSLRQEYERKMLEKRLVLVRDIAKVIDGYAEKTSISRLNGKENIAISIQKQANANAIRVVERVREALATLKEDVEARGIHFRVVYDHSEFIRDSLVSLGNEAQSGGFLAFLCLFMFLRMVGPSLLVTVSIPISVLATFFCMALSGITLNTMSLQGLALAIGMIVDTSIVVLENIFRLREGGMEAKEAAVKGTNEVLWPVITSNMTTIAVFFPVIVFVPGIPGQLFRDLSWVIIYTQVISTIVPLTVVPMLSTYCKVKPHEYKPINLVGWFEKALKSRDTEKKQALYLFRVLFVVLVIFSSVFYIVPRLEKEVLPKVDQGQFLVKVDMPLGTRLTITDELCRKIEDLLKDIPEIEEVAVTVGAEKSKAGEVKIETLRPSQGVILVTLKKERKRTSADIVAEMRKKMAPISTGGGEVDFVLQESEFAFAEGGVKPIMIEIRGYSFEVMTQLVAKVKEMLASIPGVLSIDDDMGKAAPETKMEIDKRRAALYGISALDISLTAKAAIEGVVATQFREAGKEYDIRVRLNERDRANMENLNSLLVYSQVLDSLIPLKEVAKIERGVGPGEIRRANQERTTIVAADIAKDAKSTEILSMVQKKLIEFQASGQVPPDFQVLLSGKAKEVKENFEKVTFAFVLAFILNYMIMASQFESFLQPFIIMFTVPLALIGVAVALLITGTSLNVISLLGIILLVGVPTNNGIVIIEFINQLRDEGWGVVDAAIHAAKIRARPILMSVCTSIMGLIPLVLGLGEGDELRAPMGITVMGGLISSTLLTLIVIPALYILFSFFTDRFTKEPEDEEEEEKKVSNDPGSAEAV
ncbi:MAG: efflux RND transporter permease subunit, partial [Candidatus Omnitrophica bacterium]|nr:efflux RND transporter permease subunit [Candidatus Omnitrophota bacterium]